MKRRSFVKGAAAITAAPLLGSCSKTPAGPPHDGFNAGEVTHLIPTANHTRIRLKVSLRRAHVDAPHLRIGDRVAKGIAGDDSGQFFTFDAAGLAPETEYTLQIESASGEALCEAWPLKTFPAPDTRPKRFRLLAYTCAGGPDNLYNFGFIDAYVAIPIRQRLLARALSFAPDAAVANGDHVYWDMKSKFGWALGESWRAGWVAGYFDREAPVGRGENLEVLKRAFGPQIAGLYGVMLRSTPSYFLQDDHDYGENDEASEALRTFPADPFMLDLAQTTQRLYYPELLAGQGVPAEFTSSADTCESFGAMRYGDLFEALLYDCRRDFRNASDPALGHDTSGFVPSEIERWLTGRTATSDALHLAHMPSTPILWSAGKWGEWYPDFKDDDGTLRADVHKPYWSSGWGDQHDRLVTAASARSDRTPLFVSGDLHALAIGSVVENRGASLAHNPVYSVLTGPIGTGALGWPSKFRGQLPQPSGTLVADELISPIEENGFTLADFTEDAVTFSFFSWHPDQGEDAIDSLEPFKVVRLPRPGRE